MADPHQHIPAADHLASEVPAGAAAQADHAAHAAHDPLDMAHLFGHVQDAPHFEVPRLVAPGGKLHIPQPLLREEPLLDVPLGFVEPLDFKITKFMLLELVAAVIVAAAFIWLARKVRHGDPPRGRLWNLLETLVVFIRDQVARPAIGKHDADRFLPYLWTMFFFILVCNLLGLVPWLGTATGALGTTAALALMTFGMVLVSGMQKLGVVGFWKAQVPHMELPAVLAVLLVPMIFAIEVLGLLVKHFVLAVRLLANMFAGHLVLAVILAFIVAAYQYSQTLYYGVVPASVLGGLAITLLELLVAFIQAYIFTFLSALFIGMAVHPH